jgi:two-component system phosphate regulon sensor histidine kinase PhoR
MFGFKKKIPVLNQSDILVHEHEQISEILEIIDEGVIATDTSAKVIYVNSMACRMLGVARERIMGNTLLSSSLLGMKGHDLILHALQTSESIIDQWVLREQRPLYLELFATSLTRQKGALLLFKDKTSDYRILEMGKDFIANASHELRTPITIIRGFAETLQDLPQISEEMLQEITAKIVRTCGRLDQVVRSLLTLSDIENLPPDRMRRGDLVFLAENCIHFLKSATLDVNVDFKAELGSAPILADTGLIELALSNLLENAVRYSSAPAEIEVRIEKVGLEVRVSIRDRGIGISEADLPHIFDRFYTVDKARSRKSGGAGLGLSIVKTIAEKHRGRVEVVSEMGRGSTFSLSLPLVGAQRA